MRTNSFLAVPEPIAIREQLRNVKRDRIMAEAERLFYERGFKGTSLDAIADAMAMTKPFVYGVYDKKTDILFDIAQRNIEMALSAVEAGIREPGSPTQRLAAVARGLTAVCIEHQAGVTVFFREEGSLEPERLAVINAQKGRLDDALAGLLQEGVDVGEFEISDVRMASLAIGGMISWTYTWYRDAGRLPADAIEEQMARFALRIAGARATS